jgi:hypothetical protein
MRIVWTLAVTSLVLASACGGSDAPSSTNSVDTIERRTVVWLDDRGLDAITAAELERAGVDAVLVRRGAINLAQAAPVLRIDATPQLAGSIPIGAVLTVEGAREGLDDEMADAVWRAVVAELAESPPSELVLDLPDVPPGMGDFIERLVSLTKLPIIPLLTFEQIGDEEAVRVAEAAGVCVIPAFGTGHPSFRGTGGGVARPLATKLEPLVGRRVAVRIAIGLRPVVDPAISVWGDDLNPLTEAENGEVRTSSSLDRTFVLGKDLNWSGVSWSKSDRIAVRWWDAARLHASFAEIDRIVLPDIVGWDLVHLPPPGARLGMGEEVLIRYLMGDGPEPEIRVDARRSGRTVRVSLANAGPFVTAVSGAGNWVEVSVSQGSLVVDGRGSWDAVELGNRRRGEWQMQTGGVANAVRFGERFLGPFEELETGRIRLSVSRARVTVRWQFQLSSGELVTGTMSR